MTTRRVGGLVACLLLLSGGQAVFAGLDDRPLPPSGIVIFDNGPIVTHPGGGAGGADVSALQWSLGLTVWGFGPTVSADRVADDFTVPAGATWVIESVEAGGRKVDRLVGGKMVFTEKEHSIRPEGVPEEEWPKGAHKLDPSKSPKHLAVQSSWSSSWLVLSSPLRQPRSP